MVTVFCLFIQKYSLSNYYVPIRMLGAEESAVNKTKCLLSWSHMPN